MWISLEIEDTECRAADHDDEDEQEDNVQDAVLGCAVGHVHALGLKLNILGIMIS